jgi:Tfp pilus assembly protein FimT
MMKTKRNIRKIERASERRNDRGIGLLEIIIVVAVISIVSAFAVIGIGRARESARLQSSMRLFAGRVERARLDAIRRHQSAMVEFTSSNTYSITMDFDGTGTASTRSYTLDENIVITNADGTAITDLPVIDFNWRGRTTQCFTNFRMQNSNGQSSTLAVTGAGDITIDTNLGATVSPGTYSNVNQTVDVSSSATISGGTSVPCEDPCSTCGASGGASSSSPPSGCSAFSINTSSVSIRKNGGSTATITVTGGTAADTITVTQPDGRTNLMFTPASRSVAASGTASFVISSRNNSKGRYSIKFTSACSSSNAVYASVNVTN